MGISPFLIQRTDNNLVEGRYFEFTGVNAGFLAYGIGSIVGGNGVIVMLNLGDGVNGLGKEIRRAVAKVYGWKNFLTEDINPVVLIDDKLNQFVGRYRKAVDEVVYIRKEKNYLVKRIIEGSDIYCFPLSKDSLVFTDFNVKGGISRNERGEVVGLQTIWQKDPMPKMKEGEFSPSEYLKQKRHREAKLPLGK